MAISLFIGEFKNLENIYKSNGERKILDVKFPLRIEIDQFLSWIRETKAVGDSYQNVPIRQGRELEKFVIKNLKEFLSVDYKDIIGVATLRYPFLNEAFLSEDKINLLTESELLKALSFVYAFSSRARYYGGLEKMLKAFIEDNSVSNIKKTINYLLFGSGNYAERIVNCILDTKYQLAHFKTSCIEETFGWVNKEEVPICNERTKKSMQWLGFGQL
jgi:hypothetical protein